MQCFLNNNLIYCRLDYNLIELQIVLANMVSSVYFDIQYLYSLGSD